MRTHEFDLILSPAAVFLYNDRGTNWLGHELNFDGKDPCSTIYYKDKGKLPNVKMYRALIETAENFQKFLTGAISLSIIQAITFVMVQ